MTRFAAVLPCLALAGGSVAAQPPADAARVAELVNRLGSPAYAERQAAERDLTAIGEPALDALAAAAKSANPEQARRADQLARLVARRAESRKTLAPTEVEIDAADATVGAVLEDLTRQLGQSAPVLVGGPDAAKVRAKKITLKTGKVPFWQAVLAVCDAAGLQVNSAGGFTAPGAQPYAPPQGGSAGRAVVLATRTGPARPAVVHGAVLVEAFRVPGAAATPVDPDEDDPPAGTAVVLQVWPEPRLAWQAVREANVEVVRDDKGQRLLAEAVTAPTHANQVQMEAIQVRGRGGRIVVVGQPGGGARFVEEFGPVDAPGQFQPNARQAYLRMKPGAKPTAALADLGGSLFGQVRSGTEVVAAVTGLTPGTAATATGNGGAVLKAVIHKDMTDKYTAEVELTYEPAAVQPAGVSDPGPGGSGVGLGNGTFQGVRVTGADGKPFALTPAAVEHRFDPSGRRMTQLVRLRLQETRNGQGPPAAVTFWGTYGKAVEVPFALRDVPVSVGVAAPRNPDTPVP